MILGSALGYGQRSDLYRCVLHGPRRRTSRLRLARSVASAPWTPAVALFVQGAVTFALIGDLWARLRPQRPRRRLAMLRPQADSLGRKVSRRLRDPRQLLPRSSGSSPDRRGVLRPAFWRCDGRTALPVVAAVVPVVAPHFLWSVSLHVPCGRHMRRGSVRGRLRRIARWRASLCVFVVERGRLGCSQALALTAQHSQRICLMQLLLPCPAHARVRRTPTNRN